MYESCIKLFKTFLTLRHATLTKSAYVRQHWSRHQDPAAGAQKKARIGKYFKKEIIKVRKSAVTYDFCVLN